MNRPAEENLWCDLLKLRSTSGYDHEVLAWTYGSGGFQVHFSLTSISSTSVSAILVKSDARLETEEPTWSSIKLPFDGMELYFKSTESRETLDMLKLYWPLAIIHHSKRRKPFVLVHIASTLDGKIATHNGDSKWIGNEENLVHAHRLRALSDAVLVGAGTVKYDQPSLNVRHVKGEDPIRLILSNRTSDFSDLKAVKNSKTYLLRDSCFEFSACDAIDEVVFYSGSDNEERTSDLLQQLYKKGVKSILIEGGSRTISNIFSSKSFDVFQIHYAPIVIGSGKNIVDLPQVHSISEATQFKNSIWTQVGDSFMITSEL